MLPDQKSAVMCLIAKCEDVVGVGEVIDCCRFSSLGALLRVTGYVLRGQSAFREGEISVEEVDKSKKLWVKYKQYFIQKGSKYERMKTL